MQIQTFKRFYGDTCQLPVKLTHPDTDAVYDSALAAKLIWTLKVSGKDSDLEALVQKDLPSGGITKREPTVAGIVVVELIPQDWERLQPAKVYEWDIQAEEYVTGATRTLAKGKFSSERDITRLANPSIPIFTHSPESAGTSLGLIPTTDALVAEAVPSSSFVHFGSSGLVPASAALNRPAHGFVRSATAAGGTVAVYNAGLLNGLSGLIPPNTYWLGENGQVAATPPSAGTIQSLGVASASDSLVVSISEPTVIST
ncbi:MAG: hypothetical protein WC378_04480 [Opitutaceae bacterium]|jgi:hypothetical protein